MDYVKRARIDDSPATCRFLCSAAIWQTSCSHGDFALDNDPKPPRGEA
jgi:hypothetical protein